MKLLHKLIAKLLYSVKDSKFWQEHLRKEEERKWQKLKDDACANLLSYLHPLINNVVEYKRQTLSATSRDKEVDFNPVKTELATTVRLIRQFDELKRFVGVQPMIGPVGFVFKMSLHEGRFEIVKETTTAMTRRLSAMWSVEAMQDLNAIHGIDLSSEVERMISDQVFTEILNEMVISMCKGAAIERSGKVEDVEANINDISKEITEKLGRLQGDFIICSPDTHSALTKSSDYSAFKNCPTVGGLSIVGTLKKMAVYVSPYGDMQNKVLVGAKGDNDCDAGLIYSPYVPLMSSGVVIDPNTFTPHMTLMTRHGLTLTNGNYFGVITLDK